MEYIKEYAQLIIESGINLREKQGVAIKTGPDTYWFAQVLAETAYERKASFVEIIVNDQHLLKTRIENQSNNELAYFPDYEVAAYTHFTDQDWAYIRIDNTEDRDELNAISPEKIQIFQQSHRKNLETFYTSLMKDEHPWCVVCAPGSNWAKKVLGEKATAKDLWEVMKPILRMQNGNPIHEWHTWKNLIRERCKTLTKSVIRSLHITAPNTDLRIGLSDKAVWIGGSGNLPDGRSFFPNLPTEEIFTVPDFRKTEGYISTTKPVLVMGKMVREAMIHIKNGSVISFTAKEGADVLENFFAIDDGAKRLGEIALVDETSPIAKSKTLFYSTLFDENASCHIAFGRGYPSCLSNGESLKNDAELLKAGCNTSLVHSDLMIGSESMDIAATLASGKILQIMRSGRLIF